MLRDLKRRLRKRRENAEWFAKGRALGEVVADSINIVSDELLLPRRDRFLSVLDGRLFAIQPQSDVTFEQQAQIELKVMLENWNQCRDEQQAEIWEALLKKWETEPLVMVQTELEEMIRAEIDRHGIELIARGLEHTAEAVEAYSRSPSVEKKGS